MRAAHPRPASITGRVARALCLTVGLTTLLAACSGSGLEGIDTTTPSYASPNATSDNAGGAAADRSDIVPLTDEQESQISTDTAFVPMERPGNAAVAATSEAAAPTAQGTAVPAKPLINLASNTSTQPGAPNPVVQAADTPAPIADAQAEMSAVAPDTQTASARVAQAAQAGSVALAPSPTGQQVVASNFGQQASVQPTPAAKKEGFLSGLFAQKAQAAPVMSKAPATPPKPVLQLASNEPKAAALSAMPRSADDLGKPGSQSMGSDLPGVRKSSLFEITRKNGIDDDSDVDLHEDEEAPVQFASAAGMGRLAPNGLLKQRDSVDVSCLKPSLVRMLKKIEGHYGKRFVVTSGYRSPSYNRKVRGARKSMHMYCAAVDVQLEGVSKWELARFARSMPGRGGVGTYCHTNSVHIDVGPERDWNWRCRTRRKG